MLYLPRSVHRSTLWASYKKHRYYVLMYTGIFLQKKRMELTI